MTQLFRWKRALTLVILSLGFLGVPASGYGIATHVWLAEQVIPQLVAADSRFDYLQSDPYARACFMYGACFPDTRSVTGRASGFMSFKQQIEGQSFVDRVKIDDTDAEMSFGFGTHDSPWLLYLVQQAQQSNDRYFLAFALGNLAHVMQDKHAQVFHLSRHTQSHSCGDVGVGPVDDPTTVGHWRPGRENELLFEGRGDHFRDPHILDFLQDAPWRLDSTSSASYQRATSLRTQYWQAADRYVRSTGGTPPTLTGILNGARLFELTATVYPYATGTQPFQDVMRLVVERYVDLEWWAQAILGVAQLITAAITGGQDLFDVVGPLIPAGTVGGAVSNNPAAEILVAWAHGPAEVQRVTSKYQGNPEAQRLLSSGYLDPVAYQDSEYQTAHHFVVDGLVKLGASRLTDDDRWRRFSYPVAYGAGVRSLLRMSGSPRVAEAPELLVFSLDYEDAASGAEIDELHLPADAGRRLRVRMELFGAGAEPQPRILELRLLADVGGGAADPVVASSSRLISAEALDIRSYTDRDRPSIELEWTVADVPSSQGLYVELGERRIRLGGAGEDVDLLFTSHLDQLAPLIDGRPHYDRYYESYDGYLKSLPIVR